MTDIVIIQVEPAHRNLSPYLFREGAHDYFKSYLDFQQTGKFSAVPFFLCCRAIELALKAIHLEYKSRKEVKHRYSHDLIKSYRDLPQEQQTLCSEEEKLLVDANSIYVAKEFEYLNVFDATTAYKRFPSLTNLETLTRKIINYAA